jgi:hypothetical protein
MNTTKTAHKEILPHARFRDCASSHRLRLHRIHLLAGGKPGSLQSTVIFDCTCGQRWLMKVAQGDVVAVDAALLAQLSKARDGQATAPPGFAGAE